jgi:hypothetical protein
MNDKITSPNKLSSFTFIFHNLWISEAKIKNFVWLYETYNKENRNIVSNQERITNIRLFLKEQREQIQSIFSHSLLSNYECLTKCIFAWLICEQYWIELSIARPKEIFRYYHAFLIDNNKCKYKMAWKRKVNDYVILTEQEIISRLKLIHPIIKIGWIIKKKVRSITK